MIMDENTVLFEKIYLIGHCWKDLLLYLLLGTAGNRSLGWICHWISLESQFFCIMRLCTANDIGRFPFSYSKYGQQLFSMNLGYHIKTQEGSQVPTVKPSLTTFFAVQKQSPSTPLSQTVFRFLVVHHLVSI